MEPTHFGGTAQEDKTTAYERVHTVVDYWDGPREGVADYLGRPHYYKNLFDKQKDEWSNIFLLKPIDLETFDLALEAWEIWLRWVTAYYEGKTALASQPKPALPEDLNRRQEISTLLADRLIVDPNNDLKLQGHFQREPEETPNRPTRLAYQKWKVRWRPIEDPTD